MKYTNMQLAFILTSIAFYSLTIFFTLRLVPFLRNRMRQYQAYLRLEPVLMFIAALSLIDIVSQKLHLRKIIILISIVFFSAVILYSLDCEIGCLSSSLNQQSVNYTLKFMNPMFVFCSIISLLVIQFITTSPHIRNVQYVKKKLVMRIIPMNHSISFIFKVATKALRNI